MLDSFQVRSTLDLGGKRYSFYSLPKLGERFPIKRLPYSMKILLENLLRHQDGVSVGTKEIEAVCHLGREARARYRDRVHAARVVLQDFTGVALRGGSRGDARRHARARGDPNKIKPLAAGRTRDRPLRCRSTCSASPRRSTRT
jgi:aconitate hydratase